MSNATTPSLTHTRECSCGRKGDQMDSCPLCRDQREKAFNINDSFIFGALKLAIIQAFFQQQHYFNSSNQQSYYFGGQCSELVANIMKSPSWKELIDEIHKEIISHKEKWNELAAKEFEQRMLHDVAQYANSWIVKDTLTELVNKTGREYALKLLQEDEGFKAKIKDAVGGDNYTVDMHVSVNIKKII